MEERIFPLFDFFNLFSAFGCNSCWCGSMAHGLINGWVCCSWSRDSVAERDWGLMFSAGFRSRLQEESVHLEGATVDHVCSAKTVQMIFNGEISMPGLVKGKCCWCSFLCTPTVLRVALVRTPPEIIIKEFTLAHHKENKNQFHRPLFSQEMTNKVETQFQCRHLQEGRRLWVLQNRWIFRRIQWLDIQDSKFRSCNSTNSLIPMILGLEDTIQKSSYNLFWFSIGCNVMDQRSGNGWCIGRIEVLAISLWKIIFQISRCWTRRWLLLWTRSSRIPNWRRRSASKSRKPPKGLVSTRKTDRLHDLRVLSSDWCSWYSVGFCYSSWR